MGCHPDSTNAEGGDGVPTHLTWVNGNARRSLNVSSNVYSLIVERDAVEQGRYWLALFNRGGESAGVERELAREPRLEVARSRYIESVARYPSRLVMLCDRATVLARSDRSPAMRRAG